MKKTKEENKSYMKEYVKNNKEKLKKYGKEYRENNKEKLKIYMKEYRENNKEIKKVKDKEYYDNNKEKLKEYSREHNKEYRENNKEKIKEYKKIYNNKEEVKKEKNNKRRIRYKEDILYRLTSIIRANIRVRLKIDGEPIKKIKSEIILGCTFKELKQHIETKFEPWMTWENHGLYNGELNYGWDIDHIIPVSFAKTEEDVIKLNHYTNLQPLCSKVNRDIKRNLEKIINKYEKNKRRKHLGWI